MVHIHSAKFFHFTLMTFNLFRKFTLHFIIFTYNMQFIIKLHLLLLVRAQNCKFFANFLIITGRSILSWNASGLFLGFFHKTTKGTSSYIVFHSIVSKKHISCSFLFHNLTIENNNLATLLSGLRHSILQMSFKDKISMMNINIAIISYEDGGH